MRRHRRWLYADTGAVESRSDSPGVWWRQLSYLKPAVARVFVGGHMLESIQGHSDGHVSDDHLRRSTIEYKKFK
jgi:hypothetical protein